jgi:cytochrome P450
MSAEAQPVRAAGRGAVTTEAALPPGPRTPGLWQMRQWFRDPVSFMEDNAERHGPIFSVRLGALKRCALIADPAAAWQVLSGNPDVFRMGPTNKIFRPVLGEKSLFLLDGDEHRHHRRLMAPAFHPGSVKGYASLIEEIAARELASWPVGEPFELQEPMRRITTESIVRIVIGVCTPERDAEIRLLVREMLAIAENPLALMPQFQREMGGRSPFGKVMDVTRRIDTLLFDEIRLRRHVGGVERGSDVMSAFAAAKPHEDAFMSDREIRDEILTLLIAGHETTANALSWSFERLLRHPVVHDRLLAELASADGEPYLDAVVRETLRQRPILPITARRLTEPRTIGGYDFPAGWTLMPCIYLIHKDPQAFPEPEAFRPERFLGDDRPSSRVWVPFGAGARHCVGSHLALMTIKSVLRTVLTRSSLVTDPEPEPIVRNNMTLAPGRGATVTLVGRRGEPARQDSPAAIS